MQRFDRALECLHQAVAIAHSIDARSELFKGHLSLSEIYQQQGDLASALHHFKEYHAWREMVFNEKADQRLKVLQVVHDTETAKREAEIEHLKTVELQQEVVEHTQARLQLQRQLEYVQALSRCSQTLLLVAADRGGTTASAESSVGAPSRRISGQPRYVFRNFQDADLGACFGIFAEACAPGFIQHMPNAFNQKVPWSLMPATLSEALQAGQPVGGPVEALFAGVSSLLENFRRQKRPIAIGAVLPNLHGRRMAGVCRIRRVRLCSRMGRTGNHDAGHCLRDDSQAPCSAGRPRRPSVR